MSAIYRSYEVLIEETADNHKTRSGGKTNKELKPHHESTRRALKVTHDLFQDAVCYYIFCLIGMVKGSRDANGKPVNRMWGYLYSETMRDKTTAVASRLVKEYFGQTDLGERPTEKLLEHVYAKSPTTGDKLANDTAALCSVYDQLSKAALQTKKRGKGKSAKQWSSLANTATFASNWYQRLSNPVSTQGGEEIKARNNAYWLSVANELKSAVEPDLRKDFDDSACAASLKLEHCFNSPTKKLTGEEALRDYGKAFGLDPERDGEFWDDPPGTAVKALKRHADPKDSALAVAKFDSEQANLRGYVSSAERRTKFEFPALSSGSKPSGTYWACLRYRFSPSPATRLHLYENIKKRKETDAADAVEDVRKRYGFAFPFFTNLLGLKSKANEAAVWTAFDKSAFKRAAEEVFKYRIRSDERMEQIRKRRAKITALNKTGEWKDEKGKPKQLGGIQGDKQRPALMRELLAELGGAIGYGMRRATIGGWADLRQEFLKIAKQGEPIDEEELEGAVVKARENSGGGFGSGAFFNKLCKEKYHPLWLPQKKREPHHPKNFVRWWVLYCEAKAELEKVWDGDEKTGQPKPISFTWPRTKNRFDETSFRPLDFECDVATMPQIDLFYTEANGKPIKLVKTNATPPKRNKSKKDDATTENSLTDETGNPLFPLTLSYRRFKRDTIADANGSSVEAKYAPPLVASEAPAFQEVGNKKPLEAAASLLPPDKHGCVHLMFSFKLEQAMQEKLAKETVTAPGENSVRIVKKSGKWVGLNFRWPIDAKTEKKKSDEPTTPEGEEIEETEAKFSQNRIWCAEAFEPFDLLSVDLGVRYAGAWCRARVKVGRDSGRPNQRTISPAGYPHEIVFDAYDFGTFRLQGEDAKIWRKDKNRGFGDEPKLEKCGSRGRITSDTERKEFLTLAEKVLPATPRLALPSEPEEMKFFPDLADHLVFRLRRRLGRVRFLSRLRWQAIGKKDKFGNDYREPETDDEKVAMRQKQRFNAVASLAYVPREEKSDEKEEDFMRDLRLTLAKDEVWSGLTYKHNGKDHGLFTAVRGGNKEERKRRKVVQQEAQTVLKKELLLDDAKWNWQALADKTEHELRVAMSDFDGSKSLIAKVAGFVWPLQDKKWKWHACSITKDGQVVQSHLERDEESSEPKRFIHGMRGLNMKRIRLMQNFRQCCQSLAKLERRYYTDVDHGLEPSPVRRGDVVHEPARAFLDKINELREQRVNQTAHMILAEALGLELKNPTEVVIDGKSKWELKSERDLHGRYQSKTKNGNRVAAIVLEDLSRYRTSQDRSRYENSQLMEWSHRAIIAKLQDMAQVFGIQVITVDARFSSRFCSRIGVPGIRCAQVAKGFEKEYPWKKWMEEKDNKGEPTERASLIEAAAKALNECGDPTAALVLPLDGGPAFLPVLPHASNKEGLEANADIGAAVNIALRAIGHPDRLDIYPVLRTEAKGDEKLEIKNRRGSLCELAAKADKRTVSPVNPPVKAEKKTPSAGEATADEDRDSNEELESGRFPYLYVAVKIANRNCVLIDDENRYQLPQTLDGREVNWDDSESVSTAQGKIFWSRVKQDCWKRIKQINATRLQKQGVQPPADWLNLQGL